MSAIRTQVVRVIAHELAAVWRSGVRRLLDARSGHHRDDDLADRAHRQLLAVREIHRSSEITGGRAAPFA
jgi:hypothetical protein